MSQRSRPEAVKTTVDSYDVRGVLPIEGFDSVRAGDRLGLVGSSMLGKRDVVLDLLARGSAAGQPALFISTDTSARRIVDAFVDRGGDASKLAVVDCLAVGGDRVSDSEAHVEYVAAPDDLTGVGIGISKCTRAIGDDATGGVRVAFDSLSTFLRSVEERRAIHCLQILLRRFTAANYLTVCTLDSKSHDDRTVQSARSLFDAAVEFRETDTGEREVRIVGYDGVSRRWGPFD